MIVRTLQEQAGEDSAKTVAIMILMAREARRDPDFPDYARSWLDRSLGDMLTRGDAKETDTFYIYAREHFQQLLGSAEKIADHKKTAMLRERPKPKSFWTKLLRR